jgi:hypothetical protein
MKLFKRFLGIFVLVSLFTGILVALPMQGGHTLLESLKIIGEVYGILIAVFGFGTLGFWLIKSSFD